MQSNNKITVHKVFMISKIYRTTSMLSVLRRCLGDKKQFLILNVSTRVTFSGLSSKIRTKISFDLQSRFLFFWRVDTFKGAWSSLRHKPGHSMFFHVGVGAWSGFTDVSIWHWCHYQFAHKSQLDNQQITADAPFQTLPIHQGDPTRPKTLKPISHKHNAALLRKC